MNILFLGDSITDCDHCFTPDNLGNGYVKYLSDLLPDCTLVNGGTDGFTFPRIYHKWKTMYQNRSFDAVVILGGINDVSVLMETGFDADRADQYLSYSISCLENLLQELHNSGTDTIIIIEPFLFDEFGWTAAWNCALIQMRTRIRCATRNHALLLSFSDYLNTPGKIPSLSADGVHLTPSGHHLLAQVLSEYLKGEIHHE